MRTAYQSRSQDLARRLTNTRLDAILDHETVYFRKEMKSDYEDGANIRGTGQKTQLLLELNDHFKDKRLHEKPLLELEREIVEAFKRFGTVMRAIQQQTIAEITGAVEDLTTKKPAISKEARALKSIRLILARERAKLAGAAQKLTDIRAKYPGVQVDGLDIPDARPRFRIKCAYKRGLASLNFQTIGHEGCDGHESTGWSLD
nr:hypothetical protein B0A51_11124 [Rachicladosporium sp. CCFEE 5018]